MILSFYKQKATIKLNPLPWPLLLTPHCLELPCLSLQKRFLQTHLGLSFFFYKTISPRTHDRGGDCGSLFPSCVRCGSRNKEAWGLSASLSAPPGPPPLTLEHRYLAMALWGWGSKLPGPFSPVGTRLALGSWTEQPLRHPCRVSLKEELPAMS